MDGEVKIEAYQGYIDVLVYRKVVIVAECIARHVGQANSLKRQYVLLNRGIMTATISAPMEPNDSDQSAESHA